MGGRRHSSMISQLFIRPNKFFEIATNKKVARSFNRRPDGNGKSGLAARAVKVNLLVANSPKKPAHTLTKPVEEPAGAHVFTVTRAHHGWCRLLHGAAPFSVVTALHRRPNDTLLKEVQFCMALIALSRPGRRSKTQTPPSRGPRLPPLSFRREGGMAECIRAQMQPVSRDKDERG